MGNFLFLAIFLIFSSPSFSNELPDYGSDNLVTSEEERLLYFEALALNLQQQGLGDCKVGRKWQLVDYVLNNEGKSELYLLGDESPLFVIRLIGVNSRLFGVNVVDFKIFTNEEMTKVKKVEHIDYLLVSFKDNVGTLKEPVFEYRNIFRVVRSESCY